MWLILLKKQSSLNLKINDVSNLAIKTALTAVDNKIPSIGILLIKQIIIQKLQNWKETYWSKSNWIW